MGGNIDENRNRNYRSLDHGRRAAIIVAILGLIGNRKKSAGERESSRDIKIKQKATGNINTQIGIQITKKEGDTDDA